MKTIGFFSEQLPNGLITRSSNRLMCVAAFMAGCLLLLILMLFDISAWNQLLDLVKEDIIKPPEMKLMFSGINMIYGAFVFTLWTYAFGFKAYSKNQELNAGGSGTPLLDKNPQEQSAA